MAGGEEDLVRLDPELIFQACMDGDGDRGWHDQEVCCEQEHLIRAVIEQQALDRERIAIAAVGSALAIAVTGQRRGVRQGQHGGADAPLEAAVDLVDP